MADTKFSQIASGGSFTPLTDSLLAVRNGTTDYLVQAPSTVGVYNPLDNGAKFDGLRLFDCTVPSHGNTVTSATYTFVAGDVGKVITVSPPVNAFSGPPIQIPVYTGTILSVSAGVATLGGNQSGTALSGNGVVTFGTDDTAAINATIALACPLGTPTSPNVTSNAIQGGTVVIPRGIAMTTSPLIVRTEVNYIGSGMGVSCIKWASTHAMATTGWEAAFVGLTANGSTRQYQNIRFSGFEIDMDAAQVNSGYGYQAKAIEILHCINLTVDNMFIHGSPATAVGCDFLSGCIFTNNIIANAGHLKGSNISTGGGGAFNWETSSASYGPNVGYNSVVVANNIVFNTYNSAFENEGGDLGNPDNSRTVIDGNLIVTSQAQGNGIRDKGMVGAVITNNVCLAYGTETFGIGIGAVYGGKQGIIANNYIEGFFDGITLEDNVSTKTSNNGYSIRGNTVKNSVNFGMKILESSANTLATLNVTDNYIDSSGSAGIAFVYSVNMLQSIAITNAGTGYTAGTYALGFSGGGGTGATGTYTVDGTLTVVSILITAAGTGYTSAPAVSFPSGGGSGAAATAVVNTPGTITNLMMLSNTISNNAKTTATDAYKSGIAIQTIITGAKISDNYCFDNGSSTQKYGITVDTAGNVTKAMVTDNNLNDNTTTGLNIVGTLTGWIDDNWGYNPQGAASLSPGASPWTYTAGNTPEIIYLYGGTVSSVAKNSVTLATALSATTAFPVSLRPGEQMIVTYSVVPTAVKDKR